MFNKVRREQQAGVILDIKVMDTTVGNLSTIPSYKAMYAFGNHYKFLSSKT